MIKKILFISIDGFKNDSRMTKQAITLAQAGYKVKIISIHKEDLKEQEENEFFEVTRIKLKSKKWSKLKIIQLLKMYEFNMRVIKYLKQENFIPDIIQVFTPYPLKTAFLIKQKLNNYVKIIYDPREYIRAQNTNKLNRKIMLYLEKKYIKKVNKIVTVGNFIADFYQEDYSLKEKPIVLRNIPFYYQRNQDNKNYLRELLNIPKEKRILLYQGMLMKGRGLEILLYVLKKLPENVVLIYMGEGILRKELETITKELGLRNRVYFTLVNNKELIKYTNGADLGVYLMENTCLNHFYSLPNKFFEFIQGELPMVFSNFPEMKRIIEKYKIGITVDPQNIEESIKEINDVLNNNKKYNFFKENLLLAKKELCWENESKKLINLYQNL